MFLNDLQFLDAIAEAGSREELIASLTERLKAYGIGGFAYSFVPLRTSRGLLADLRELHHHHTYPQDWEAAMDGSDPFLSDPTTPMFMAGAREVDWTAPDDAPDALPPENLKRHEAAKDLGMRFGMDMLLAEDHRGRLLSGTGLWFSDRPDAASFWADWARYGGEITSLLHMFDAAVRGRKAPEMIGLTARETDMLKYLANGYRSAEASWAMKVSEKTFEKYVASAKRKLNARTRDQAVARALVLGLIEP